MLKRFLRISVVVVVCSLGAESAALAQQASFDGAVADIRAGDFLRGLAALNELVKQSPPPPQLAMAHAYRALAYARMDQGDRARAAAAQALQVDPKVAVGPPDFPPDVAAMFDRLRNLSAAELGAFTAAATKPTPAPAPAPAAAPPAPAAPPPPPATGNGTIVFYRPSAFVGGARRMKIECNGVKVADLQNGRVFTLKAAAGFYNIKVQGEDATVDVAPGGEYFFRASMAGSQVTVVPNEKAKAEMKERKMKPNDASSIYSEECKS